MRNKRGGGLQSASRECAKRERLPPPALPRQIGESGVLGSSVLVGVCPEQPVLPSFPLVRPISRLNGERNAVYA